MFILLEEILVDDTQDHMVDLHPMDPFRWVLHLVRLQTLGAGRALHVDANTTPTPLVAFCSTDTFLTQVSETNRAEGVATPLWMLFDTTDDTKVVQVAVTTEIVKILCDVRSILSMLTA